MINKMRSIGLIGAIIAAMTALGAWHHAYGALTVTSADFFSGELQPKAGMLKENQALISELQADPFAERDSGILEFYLANIRHDGIAKHADMKQRLDTLAENNTSVVALIKAYAPHAKTAAFGTEADKFRNFAYAWCDRWNSVMELFMGGGNYAAAGVPFPKDFPAAVDAEMAAAN